MSFLKDMIGKAKGWLGDREPAAGSQENAVKHDRFDEAIFRELLDTAPALEQMVNRLSGHYDYTENLVRDTTMAFWKADPDLESEQAMNPAFLHNWAVANRLAADENTPRTRQYTKHDQYGAAMAAVGVGDKVEKWLQEHEEERKEAEKAKEEQDKADEAAQQAEDAANACQEAMGDYDGEGPLTEDQQAAADALAQALAQAQAQQAQANAQAQAAQQAMSQAVNQLNKQVSQAVKEVGDKLADEAATMSAWGIGPGQLEQMSFEDRRKLAMRLNSGRLAKFRQLIGRFRTMAAAQRSRKTEYGRDEVSGVELSGDLPRVLGGEFAKSKAHPALRLEFLEKLAEEKLLSRKYRGEEKIGDGAIIACVDTSGSMSDTDSSGITREAWAKAFALALLDQARAGKRDFVCVLFSDSYEIKVFHFPKGMGPIEQVVEMVETFFNGGTDFQAPMDAAVDILEREFNDAGKIRGDIVFMTDGSAGVSPQWMKKYQERKKKLSFRTFGIQIGDDAYGRMYGRDGETVLAAMSDNVRNVTEFGDPNDMKDLVQVI